MTRVLGIAPGPGVADFRERVCRVHPYRDDCEALRRDFERSGHRDDARRCRSPSTSIGRLDCQCLRAM